MRLLGGDWALPEWDQKDLVAWKLYGTVVDPKQFSTFSRAASPSHPAETSSQWRMLFNSGREVSHPEEEEEAPSMKKEAVARDFAVR